jgi:hypothetical protein
MAENGGILASRKDLKSTSFHELHMNYYYLYRRSL